MVQAVAAEAEEEEEEVVAAAVVAAAAVEVAVVAVEVAVVAVTEPAWGSVPVARRWPFRLRRLQLPAAQLRHTRCP